MIDFDGIRDRPVRAGVRRADGAARGADAGRPLRPRRRHLSEGRGAAAASRPATCSTKCGCASGESIRRRPLRLRARPVAAEALPRRDRRPKILPTRQEVFFFAPPAGDRRFLPAAMPGWADFNGGDIFYGFPDLESRGVKFAHDQHGVAGRPRHAGPPPDRGRAGRDHRVPRPPLPAAHAARR